MRFELEICAGAGRNGDHAGVIWAADFCCRPRAPTAGTVCLEDEEGIVKATELGNVARLGGGGRDRPPPSVRDAALPNVEVPIALFEVLIVIESPSFEQGCVDPVRAFIADARRIVGHLVDTELG